MKTLDRSDHQHLNKICADMLRHLSNATIIINDSKKEDFPPSWDKEKSARAVDKIALFVATFPFLYAFSDYTDIIRHLIQTLNEYNDPTLEENN